MAEFFGEHFDAPERFNMRAFTRFAALASKGVDDADMEAVAAIDALITQCVSPGDLPRFEATCDRERPSLDELIEFVGAVMSEVSERPTRRPSDSSDGSQPTSVTSVVDSSSRVIARLESEGRPSLALAVQQATGSRVSA